MKGASSIAPMLPDEVAAAAERFGVQRVSSLGRSGSTLLLHTRAGRIVVKRIDARRDPRVYRELLGRLAQAQPPLAPRLFDVVPDGGEAWHALFDFMETGPQGPGFQLSDVLALLARLRACDPPSHWPLDSWWLERLRPAFEDERPAAAILQQLEERAPRGPRALAHGDFNLPNVVAAAAGVGLVDWEEVGSAPCGFDAGWLLALARAEAGVPWPYDVLKHAFLEAELPAWNLDWFERLGVLRLLYRARTDILPEAMRPLLVAAIRRVVARLATED